MKKSKEEAKPIITVWDNKSIVCQCCKFHYNKPSTCSKFNKSVGRKEDASSCKDFKEGKHK
jgi:hypothetical protein